MIAEGPMMPTGTIGVSVGFNRSLPIITIERGERKLTYPPQLKRVNFDTEKIAESWGRRITPVKRLEHIDTSEWWLGGSKYCRVPLLSGVVYKVQWGALRIERQGLKTASMDNEPGFEYGSCIMANDAGVISWPAIQIWDQLYLRFEEDDWWRWVKGVVKAGLYFEDEYRFMPKPSPLSNRG